MTITSSPRLGLTRWSDSDTDTFSRAQMDASHAAIDNLAAVDVQGLLASRPAPGVRGRWYATTDATKQLFREDGATWREVALLETGGTFGGLITANAGLAIPGGQDIALSSTTGTKLGTASTQKLGVLGATPVAQQGASANIEQVLTNFGFMASGGNPNLAVGSGTITGGTSSFGSAAAKVQLSGSGTSSTVAGTGTATDVDLNLVPRGAGKVIVKSGAGVAHISAGTNLAFWSGTGAGSPTTLTGSRGGVTPLAGLLSFLAQMGLIIDNTTA